MTSQSRESLFADEPEPNGEPGFGECEVCGLAVERVGWDDLCFACQEADDDAPADCPGGGIDDLCSWPDTESCGLCTLGKNPAVYS